MASNLRRFLSNFIISLARKRSHDVHRQASKARLHAAREITSGRSNPKGTGKYRVRCVDRTSCSHVRLISTEKKILALLPYRDFVRYSKSDPQFELKSLAHTAVVLDSSWQSK
jgi:hypothetical protein